MHSLAAVALGGAHWGKGDVVAAQHAFARASATAQQSGYPLLAVSAACYVGMQQTKQGRLREALETYREALELATGPDGREPPVAGFPLMKLGDLAREWNDLDTAGRDLVQGVELCVQWGQADAVVDGYVALARLRLAQGDSREAAQILQRAEHLARRTKADPWITCWLDDCRIRLWLSTEDLAAAVHWAETSGLRADGELVYQHDLNHINLARVRVAQGVRQPCAPYLDEALGLLARLLEAAERADWINEVIKILILQALALQARGGGEEAVRALTRALTLAEPGAYVRTFIDEGPPMGELLRQAAALGTAVDYGSRLLAALEAETENERRDTKLAPPLSALRPSPLIEPLSKRELEVLRLWAAHLTRTDIAEELFISVNTVRSHIKNIYSKLGAHSRKDAIQRAKRQGLL
jgi:LuxR family maltose regulon positive regulatory protein